MSKINLMNLFPLFFGYFTMNEENFSNVVLLVPVMTDIILFSTLVTSSVTGSDYFWKVSWYSVSGNPIIADFLRSKV